MAKNLRKQLETCITKFRQGVLTEQDLNQALECAGEDKKCARPYRRLLYLQSRTTLVTTPVEGMALVDRDGVHDGPRDPDDWPYQTVHEALLDGWRIVKFPELALMAAGEEETWGLGCEFILEKCDDS